MNTPPLRKQFMRTVCACQECTGWCRKMPGCLAVGDLDRIAEYLEIGDRETLESLFSASPGALVGQNGKTWRIGTIVPRKTEAGACTFLDADGKCEIWPVAPFGCSHFDAHMGKAEGDRRSMAMLREIMQDAEYNAARNRMIENGQTAQSPEVLRWANRE